MSFAARFGLRLHHGSAIDLVEAVRVERETNDLIDEPLAIALGERRAQLLLERGNEIMVDGTDDALDRVHEALRRLVDEDRKRLRRDVVGRSGDLDLLEANRAE